MEENKLIVKYFLLLVFLLVLTVTAYHRNSKYRVELTKWIITDASKYFKVQNKSTKNENQKTLLDILIFKQWCN